MLITSIVLSPAEADALRARGLDPFAPDAPDDLAGAYAPGVVLGPILDALRERVLATPGTGPFAFVLAS